MAAGLAAALRSISRGFAHGDQAQRQRGTAAAANPDGTINPIGRGLAECVDQVQRLTALLLPTRILPGGPDHHIAAVRQHIGNAVRLQMHAVGNADLAPHHRDAIQLLTLMLVGQHEVAEPLAGNIERAVDPPQPVLALDRTAGLRHR